MNLKPTLTVLGFLAILAMTTTISSSFPLIVAQEGGGGPSGIGGSPHWVTIVDKSTGEALGYIGKGVVGNVSMSDLQAKSPEAGKAWDLYTSDKDAYTNWVNDEINTTNPYPYQALVKGFQNLPTLPGQTIPPLPMKPPPPGKSSYYTEITIPTPGLPNRGEQRFVMGAGSELYYTNSHYLWFYRILMQKYYNGL